MYATDITQRKRAEQEREQLLQTLAKTEERQRLARELHDAVSQNLFSASLVADILPQLWQYKPAEALRRTKDLKFMTRGALAEMRILLLELRPEALTQAPLSDVLRHLAAVFAGRAPRCSVHITTDGDHPLAPDLQIGLYRITQDVAFSVPEAIFVFRASI